MLDEKKQGKHFQKLIDCAAQHKSLLTAVVYPLDELSLKGALQAFKKGFIQPIIFAPQKKLQTLAKNLQLSLEGVEIIDVPHAIAAADEAIAFVRAKKAEALMKGAIHTSDLMKSVLHKQKGLRLERRLSHVFAVDVPHYHKMLFVSDAALNIEPDLTAKIDITQNAIDFVRAMGVKKPKVALLSAIEKVNPKIPSTLDAAALCKMVDRGQITDAILDGPLAFDNAISKDAAKTKHISSPVVGDADLLITPNLEAGNVLVKQLEYLSDARGAGIVVGASVPIILTSRSDSALARVMSCAMAVNLSYRQ